MKLQCDVCGVEQASVLCCADEAVLCTHCDACIHSANKLAGKHRRFSLHHPLPLPLCDICKEKNGFLFCQEDRAILCRDCDFPIHTATVHSSHHNRFLLTGIRISSTPVPHQESPPLNNNKAVPVKVKDGGGSSISDYLMKMLPGWRVDDFLFDDAFAADACKGYEAPPVAAVPLFTTTTTTVMAAAVEAEQPLQWSSEERGRSRRSEEDVSTVPELSRFHCDYYMNDSKRCRNSL